MHAVRLCRHGQQKACRFSEMGSVLSVLPIDFGLTHEYTEVQRSLTYMMEEEDDMAKI
jgi:hypothetical protein